MQAQRRICGAALKRRSPD